MKKLLLPVFVLFIFFNEWAQTDKSNGVVINEVMAQNTNVVTDENGQYEDWIELYNNGSSPVDLSGYYLTDDSTVIGKWQIPSGTTIDGNGYLIIWADNDSTDGVLHANFKLAAAGELVMLSTESLELVDEVIFGQQTANLSYARVPNGTGSFVIQAPTFGTTNDDALGIPVLDEQAVLMYPNPARETVYVQLDEPYISGTIRIFDVFGKMVLEQDAGAQNAIDVKSLERGSYFLSFESENQSFTQKIILID